MQSPSQVGEEETEPDYFLSQVDGSSEDQSDAGGDIEHESLLASVDSEGLGGEVISTDAHKSFWDKLTRVARGAANTGG